jgi:hypothetical protein
MVFVDCRRIGQKVERQPALGISGLRDDGQA